MSCASPSRADRLRLPLLLLLVGGAAPTHASKPRLRLEHAQAASCGKEAVLEVHFAELELEGQLRRRSPSDYRVVLDGQTQPVRALSSSTFARSGRRLRLAVVVQSTASYATSLDRLRGGLRELLRAVPREARLTVIAYDSQARRLLALGDPRQATAALDSLDASGAAVDLALDEALTLGMRSLGPVDPGQRRLLLLISDGVNRSPKRDLFRGLGSRARTLQIPIHPIGFSPIDERGPLLNLGELAKRSIGTMRWAQRAEDLGVQLANLAGEINDQTVLRFPWPGGCRRVARLQVTTGDLLSNSLELNPAGVEAPRPPGKGRALGLFLGGLFAAAILLTLAARALIGHRGRSKKPTQKPRRRPPR